MSEHFDAADIALAVEGKEHSATVTSECWRNKWQGELCWYSPGNTTSSDWQRFPAGDFTGEVEE